MNEQLAKDDPVVPWNDFVRFLRQLSHDIRNNLNAAELQAAYLNELADTAETKEEVKRLREMIGEVSRSLQRVTSKIMPVASTRIEYRCADFVDDIKQKLASSGPAAGRVTWDVELGDAMFEIDPALLQEAVLELFENAASHSPEAGPVRAASAIKNGHFEFSVSESKKNFPGSTRNWGREPMRTIGRGHYGLGLNRVRMIVAAHVGSFSAEFDPDQATLVNRIVLPLVSRPND